MTTTADTLRAARALIESPDAWRQYNDADPDGDQPHGQRACALEAVSRSTPLYSFELYDTATCALQSAMLADDRLTPVITYNDEPSTTHADILALFDRAIAAQED